MTDERGVDFIARLISGSSDSTSDSGADGADVSGDKTAHGTIPRLEIGVGMGFDNVGGECSRADIDGDLGEETWLGEWVTRGGDDKLGEENRLDE